jgi:hypothetical protein
MTWIPALLLILAAGWFVARASAAALFGRANPLAGFAGELGLAVLLGPVLAPGPGSGTAGPLVAKFSIGAMLATKCAVFLVTTSGLAWQVGTAASRLVLRVWPGLI